MFLLFTHAIPIGYMLREVIAVHDLWGPRGQSHPDLTIPYQPVILLSSSGDHKLVLIHTLAAEPQLRGSRSLRLAR